MTDREPLISNSNSPSRHPRRPIWRPYDLPSDDTAGRITRSRGRDMKEAQTPTNNQSHLPLKKRRLQPPTYYGQPSTSGVPKPSSAAALHSGEPSTSGVPTPSSASDLHSGEPSTSGVPTHSYTSALHSGEPSTSGVPTPSSAAALHSGVPTPSSASPLHSGEPSTSGVPTPSSASALHSGEPSTSGVPTHSYASALHSGEPSTSGVPTPSSAAALHSGEPSTSGVPTPSSAAALHSGEPSTSGVPTPSSASALHSGEPSTSGVPTPSSAAALHSGEPSTSGVPTPSSASGLHSGEPSTSGVPTPSAASDLHYGQASTSGVPTPSDASDFHSGEASTSGVPTPSYASDLHSGQASTSGVPTPSSPAEFDSGFRRESDEGASTSTRPDFVPSDYYHLEQLPPVNFKGGYVTSSKYRIRFNSIPGTGIERMEYMLAMTNDAFGQILQGGDPDTVAQVFMENERLFNAVKPTRRVRLRELNCNDLVKKLFEAEQSSGVDADDDDDDQPGSVIRIEDTTFTLVTFRKQRAGGHSYTDLRSRKEVNQWVFIKKKHCVIDPMTKTSRTPRDLLNACIPYSIIVGAYINDQGYVPRSKESTISARAVYEFTRSYNCQDKVRQLIRDSGLQGLGPFEIGDIDSIQTYLGDLYQICVYDNMSPPIAKFGPDDAESHINLFLKGDYSDQQGIPVTHCVVITSMKAFMGKDTFCQICKKTAKATKEHRCEAASCMDCRLYACKNRSPRRQRRLYKQCDKCNYPFFTAECLDAHRQIDCSKNVLCLKCYGGFTAKQMPKHKCGESYCHQCGVCHISTEYCYVRAVKGKTQPHLEGGHQTEEMVEAEFSNDEEDEDAPATAYAAPRDSLEIWYADAETVVEPASGQHTANLVVLQSPVKNGAPLEIIYRGPSAMRQFTEDCIKKDSPFKKSTIVWHNASKFDAHLWWRELMLLEVEPDVIFKGQAIIGMTLKQNRIKCRDSLQFIPGTALAKFPGTFGLESGAKGDFPHGLNTHEWVSFEKRIVYKETDEEGTVHRFPQLHYFFPGNKRPKERASLEAWHCKQVAKYAAAPSMEYVPAEELEAYCKQDVRILMEGYEKYRLTWLVQYMDMEPLDYLTFPSFNNAIFRTKYMKPNSICLLPPMGFQFRNNKTSRECFAWLSCKERELEESGHGLVLFRDARRGFEVKIAGLSVDGYGVEANGTKHVFQYHGCYWHGCPCQDGKRTSRSEEQIIRYERTLEHDARLEEASNDPESPYAPFIFHTIFGCSFKNQIKDNHNGWYKAHTKAFAKDWSDKPLQPRDALRGGRTNCIKHSVEVDPEKEELYYMDFNSHYPAVNFGMHGETWPIGMPSIYIGMDVNKAPSLKDSFGLWSCEVLPPRRLRHPVLGDSCNGKYTFYLCKACAVEERYDSCDHTEDQRKISGVFFTEELKLAREKGYKILKVSEVWDWDEEHRDKNMFRGLILDQYKRKACASAVSDEDLDAVIDEYAATMGLILTREDFHANPAMRSLAKFSLNNIWGFFGKRGDVATTKITGSLSELNTIDNDINREITALKVIMDGEFLQIQHKPVVEPSNRHGNVVLAALTTAYARIELYRVIDKYSEQVVYFDTDSVFLLLPKGMEPPPSSSVLGGLKDEIKEAFGPGHRISSFHSLGPKTYTYTVVDDSGVVKHVELKAKGISLSSDALGVVSSGLMRQIVSERQTVAKVPQFQISRKISEGLLYSRNYDKVFRFASTKRVFLPEPNPRLDTLPFGYLH